MKRALRKYISDPDRVEVIHNWSSLSLDTNWRETYSNDIQKYRLSKEDFVILYSGNMGYTHDLTPLIKAANRLKDVQRIKFVFIGDGAQKEELMTMVSGLELSNCLFFSRQDDLLSALSIASIGVVSLNGYLLLLVCQ